MEEEDLNQRVKQTLELINVEEVLKGRDGIEKTINEIEELKQTYNYNLEQKNINPKAQVTLY